MPTHCLFPRGDNSGTHAKEKTLWTKAAITPAGRNGTQETGAGMGHTLNVASEKKGYTLTDRGTYLATKKNLGLEILNEGDAALLNIYHVIEINAAKWPKVNAKGAKAFLISWFLKEPRTLSKLSVLINMVPPCSSRMREKG